MASVFQPACPSQAKGTAGPSGPLWAREPGPRVLPSVGPTGCPKLYLKVTMWKRLCMGNIFGFST